MHMKTSKVLTTIAAIAAISAAAYAGGWDSIAHSKAFPKSAPAGATAKASGMTCKSETVTTVDRTASRGHGQRLVTFTRHGCTSCESVEVSPGGKLTERKVAHLCSSASACCK